MRTIVIADVHGNLNLLRNALDHAKLSKEDRVIFAGDFCDIGYDTYDVQTALEDIGAEVLFGNHEIAHMFGHAIKPYDYKLDSILGLVEGWITKFLTREWKLATSIKTSKEYNDILVTHAGVSDLLGEKLVCEGLTAFQIAEKINDRFFSQIMLNHSNLLLEPRDHYLVYNEFLSPVWWRPFTRVLASDSIKGTMPFPVRQIAGHTPREHYDNEELRHLERMGFYLIDPYQGGRMNIPGYCMYAVVEDDEVNIIESTNSRDCNKES
jgi:hypothetical protein